MATIRKRGDKWQVQVRRFGVCSISKSFLVLKDAEVWARHIEVQADRHALPPDPKALSRVTLGELVLRYRNTVSAKKRTYDRERYSLNQFLRHPMCRKWVSEVRQEDFASYRDERLECIKPSSLKRELAIIHHLFAVARDEWGLPIQQIPLDKLKLNGADKGRERRLSLGELERLLDAAACCQNILIAPIIRLAVETGMRRGEILGIKRCHISDENRSLLIPQTKNGVARTIPLTRAAIALLDGLSAQGDRLFPITANAFRLSWERLKRRAGIDDLHFHDLRHEAISRLFELGLTTPEVALISGHKDVRMLLRYSHAMRERVLEKFDCQVAKST